MISVLIFRSYFNVYNIFDLFDYSTWTKYKSNSFWKRELFKIDFSRIGYKSRRIFVIKYHCKTLCKNLKKMDIMYGLTGKMWYTNKLYRFSKENLAKFLCGTSKEINLKINKTLIFAHPNLKQKNVKKYDNRKYVFQTKIMKHFYAIYQKKFSACFSSLFGFFSLGFNIF